ncbi:OLC1v1026707C1 [Oldenlandia corymbosa var. corymbosa]|uniref:OLC1v1026707C1 n=1 Tax=Oldenlandia corymbosa var. corymbosa TaxID=529605 RepID=A0AAV1C7N8_OLDCO|nr:OLC1v1026707C1 [Oldenlandia corymbosa var. corymbosa]
MNLFSLKIIALSILSLVTSTANTTTIGVTYNPSATTNNLPTPEQVASTLLSHLHVSSVHLLNPTPAAIRAFSYSNISLLLTIPNDLISSFAANISSATQWVYTYVLPFHPRARISLISLGSDVVSSLPSMLDPTTDPSTLLIPAMRNLQQSLYVLGIRTIPVSTTFSYISIITTTFPPSSAEFQEPINNLLIKPVLQFLDENNSSFLIDIHPFNVYKLRSEIPVGFALFQDIPYNFRDDAITGARYRNLFDMMVDGVIAALANFGHQNIPMIVTQTGWPSAGEDGDGSEVSPAFAQIYLKGLISHLKSGLGTPLRKDGLAEVYVYELFDEASDVINSNRTEMWGILYPNMTKKFSIDFSGSARAFGRGNLGIYGNSLLVDLVLPFLMGIFVSLTL